jgi:hypothetical protein
MRKYFCWILGHYASIMYKRDKKMYGVCEYCRKRFKIKRRGY